ncbi:unnamed protein product [Ectocarpus sp. 6 AP-2014]
MSSRKVGLVACMASLLCSRSYAWTAAVAAKGNVLQAHRPHHISRSAAMHRSRRTSGVLTRQATSEDGEEAAVPAKREPWWEDERRTQGVPTLSGSTQWRMLLSLKDPTLGGEAGDTTEVAVRVRFDEERDFEPPQGSLEVIEDNPYFTQQAGKARWTLSEAEDTRGAGLWVWGLFKDPLYPFLLLQVNNLEIPLKGGAKIAPGRLYVKVDHRRDDELGPTLKSGTVGVKIVERVRVDPLGMAEADITNVVPCGSVQFRPV